MKLSNLKLIGTFVLACLLTACVDSNDTTTSNDNTSKADSQTTKQPSAIVSVTDFTGTKIELAKPAKKIIALAPHIVENVFTAGAGAYLVGAVTYSNYPEQAKELPLVGGYASTTIEKIIQLEPDLIIAWESGNSNNSVARIRELGYPIYIDQPNTLEDIAKSIADIGTLAGTLETANPAAQEYLSAITKLREKSKNKDIVSAFYQVWNSPLQTINGGHFISAAIELCGGRNIYATEQTIAPVINIESILERDPDAIIASGMGSARPEWLDDWQQWPSLKAVKQNNLFFVNPDHIQRHTVRLLHGIEAVCSQLDIARARRSN